MTTLVLISLVCLLYIDGWIEGKIAVARAQDQMQEQMRKLQPNSFNGGTN